MMGPILRPAAPLACALALTACSTSRVENGAALAPGQWATVRIFGPRARFDLRNVGVQAFEYRLEEPGATSGGTLEPGSRVAESRAQGDLTLTISNPGPGPVQAMVESSSRGGVEFRRPGN